MGKILKEYSHQILVALAIGLLIVICVGGVRVTVVSQDSPGPTPTPTPEPDNPQPDNPDPPNPGPTPPTPPPPDPGPIDGQFGIARLAWKSAKDVNRPAECSALAGAFRQLAQYVRTNEPGLLTIVGIPGVRDGLLQQYLGQAIPPASRPAWAAFGEVLKAAIRAAYDAGKLKDSSAWASCFDEVATGLEAVR